MFKYINFNFSGTRNLKFLFYKKLILQKIQNVFQNLYYINRSTGTQTLLYHVRGKERQEIGSLNFLGTHDNKILYNMKSL